MLLALVYLLIEGAGAWSIDSMLSRDAGLSSYVPFSARK
jgi:hypothetical protein